MKRSIAVVGAGISGLTCAYNLQNAGFKVDVFEKNSSVGGRMASRTKEGLTFDIGADHLGNLYSHLAKYSEEFKLKRTQMNFLNYRILYKGKLVPLNDSISRWNRFKLLFRTLLRSKKTDFFNFTTAIQYDTASARTFMNKTFGKIFTNYLVDGFVSAYQFHHSNEISRAGLEAFFESRGRGDDWDLHHLNGGMQSLPNAFAKRLNIKKNNPVKSIIPFKGKVKVTAKTSKVYDAVVIASTANITKKILKKPTLNQSKFINKVKYATTISVSFKIPKDLFGKVGIFWMPYAESKHISSFVNEAWKGKDCVNNKYTLLDVWLHEDFSKSLINKSDKQIYNKVRTEFIRVCPLVDNKSLLIPFDLQRWPEAMPKFYYPYLTDVNKFLEHGQGDNNIFLVGDYLNSPWIEGSIRCAERVANKIISFFDE